MVEHSMVSNGEAKILLILLKTPRIDHTATILAKISGLSIMGVMKIAKGLERRGFLSSRKIGRATLYSLRSDSEKGKSLIIFLLKNEAEQVSPFVRVWLRELQKITSAQSIILFGSLLKKERTAGDVDALIITTKGKFRITEKQVENISLVNEKRIHPVYQTRADLKKNIQKKDIVILQAIQGLVAFGEEAFLEVLLE